MYTRYTLPFVLIAALAVPAFAQRKERPDRKEPPPSTSIKSSTRFLGLFAPAVENARRSTVRLLVDGKEAALGSVIASDGYVVTKASEIKPGTLTVKTHDGRDLDAKVALTSEAFDLAVVKIDGSGLSPISWANSADAPVGNWLALASNGKDPVAVGVVSTVPRSLAPPYGPPRVPTEKSGFLGVQLDPDSAGATIGLVTPGSAAEMAGLKAMDTIVKIDGHEIANQESLINTLLGYPAGAEITVLLVRNGKEATYKVTLGKRPAELVPKGKGGAGRGDMQNSMGSVLSERRGGIPQFFQTDAVVKPADCGGPVVDLEGRVLGMMIARAGRVESHVIPAETMKELVPLLLSSTRARSAAERLTAANEALADAQKNKFSSAAIAEGKRLVAAAIDEMKWWKDRAIETGPTPRVVDGKPN